MHTDITLKVSCIPHNKLSYIVMNFQNKVTSLVTTAGTNIIVKVLEVPNSYICLHDLSGLYPAPPFYRLQYDGKDRYELMNLSYGHKL